MSSNAELEPGIHPTISNASEVLGIPIKNLREASKRSKQLMNILKSEVGDVVESSPLDLVALGSLAREEVVERSDLDYLIVIHGVLDPESVGLAREVIRLVERVRTDNIGLSAPGATKIFATTVSAPDLVERIGLEQDSNLTHTRRMLLLQESRSVCNPQLHGELQRAILQRYLYHHTADPLAVPRFLLNDVMRFWYTLTVDFEAKAGSPLSLHGD
jgi:hypothetical protein